MEFEPEDNECPKGIVTSTHLLLPPSIELSSSSPSRTATRNRLDLDTNSNNSVQSENVNSLRSLEDVLADIPLGRFHYRLLCMCGLVFMADSIEITLLSFLAICAGSSWDLDARQVSLITSVVFAGMLLGNLFWGPVADRFGRRVGFLFASVLVIVFGLLTGAAGGLLGLLCCRALVGFGVGGVFIPFDLLAEFLPSTLRGTFLINIKYFWSIGSIFTAGLAWACMSSFGWRAVAVLASVPVAASLGASMLLLPESPRWLLCRGRVAEAEAVLRRAAEINGTDLPPFRLKPADQPREENPIKLVGRLCHLNSLKISIPLWTIWCVIGLGYYGVVLLISRVFTNNTADSGDDDGASDTFVCDFQYSQIFIGTLFEAVGVFLASRWIDFLGRKGSQMLMYSLAAMSVLLLGLLHSFAGCAVVFSALSRMFALGAACCTWVATPELYTTEMRASAHAVASSCARVGAFFVPFLVDSPNLSVLSVAGSLSIINFIGVICSYMLVETKDFQLDSDAQKHELSTFSKITLSSYADVED